MNQAGTPRLPKASRYWIKPRTFLKRSITLLQLKHERLVQPNFPASYKLVKQGLSQPKLCCLQLFDGRLVETVGIPADADCGGRLTVCVSSQVSPRSRAPRIKPHENLFDIALRLARACSFCVLG